MMSQVALAQYPLYIEITGWGQQSLCGDISSEGHCGALGECPVGGSGKLLAPGPRTERGSRLSQGWEESGEGERHRKMGRREQAEG